MSQEYAPLPPKHCPHHALLTSAGVFVMVLTVLAFVLLR